MTLNFPKILVTVTIISLAFLPASAEIQTQITNTANFSSQYSNIVPPTVINISDLPPINDSVYLEIKIENISDFLTYWNPRLHWGFSPAQIDAYAHSLEAGVLKKYLSKPGSHWLDIPNKHIFYLELGDALGLPQEQKEILEQDMNAINLKEWQMEDRAYDQSGKNGTYRNTTSGETLSDTNIDPGLHDAPQEASISQNYTGTTSSDSPLQEIIRSWSNFLKWLSALSGVK